MPAAAREPVVQQALTQGELRVANVEAGVRRGLLQFKSSTFPPNSDAACSRCCSPRKLRGVLRFALRTGWHTALAAGDFAAGACGWKFFILAPRMLLHRPAEQQSVQANELEQRCELFRPGEWLQLLREATEASRAGGNRPGPGTDEQARAARAVQLVQLGELCATARARTAEPLAPGNADTLSELRDPDRRPPAAQLPLSDAVLVCPRPCCWAACEVRAEGRRLAPPAQPTSTYPSDCALLHRAAERLANADVPEQVLQARRLGRMVALRKPNGRVRALVVGDVFRRLVARALAQQHFAGAFQEARLPYQFGLSTPATVLAIDTVGAYDHVSRQAMLKAKEANRAIRLCQRSIPSRNMRP